MFASGSGTADPRIAKEAEALVTAGHRVTVLAWDRAGTAPALDARDGWTIESFGPPARHGAGLRNILGYRAYWRAARARTRELAPDVLHCHNLDTVPAALPLPGASGRPHLVLDFWEIYRESRALPQRGLIGRLARAAARHLERRAIPRAAFVVTVVEAQTDYYRQLGARRVLVVENAPDPSRYEPSERREPDFVIGFIGQKRWVPALASLMRAIQPHPELKALLVGGGPAEAEVAELAAQMERVEVRGRVAPDEIPALYRTIDAVYACYDPTLLNWRTAFPVKSMEAMACALPVIVTKGTWIAEYVDRNGLGYAVDDRDVADVERALVALAADRDAARDMGRRGRAIVERELNWATAAARLVDAYASLVADAAESLE
jgi:glycosyltransferase involved in cell wall biosynthesis